MTSFINIYKRTGNSVTAYKEIVNCNNKSLEEISDGSLSNLENVFEEVDFYVSNDTKRGLLKNTAKLLNGIFSLGGTYNLEIHKKHYSDIYEAVYKPEYDNIENIENKTNEYLSLIGENIIKLNKLLKPVRKIIKSKKSNDLIKNNTLTQFNKFDSGFRNSLKVGFGGLVGGTTAIGAWGLVSLIGSASTGTAISSLSGVAATNATLAWFGGGSLAAGGAGMAGGFWVLGGIVAAPIIFFSTKSSYKKVGEVKDKKDELIKESRKLIILKAKALIQLEEVIKQEVTINNLINEYIPKIENELILYKKSRSLLKDFFRLKMNPDQENHLKNLNKISNDLLYKLGMN